MSSILVVDDNPDLLELVCQMIVFSGFDARGLADGRHLFECLQSQPYDLLLMDIFMGECDGRALARTVKSDEQFSHIPVILYSAGVLDEDSIRASGADAFLKKPFEMDELLDTIRRLLRPSRHTAVPAMLTWKFIPVKGFVKDARNSYQLAVIK